MAIKLLDESEVIEGKKSEKRQEHISPVSVVTKKPLKIISADKIIVCERRKLGISSNCAICQGINTEIFNRCKNKWTDF